MLRTAARGKIPRLEWVRAEMNSMTDEKLLCGMPLAQGWAQTEVRMGYHLFYCVGWVSRNLDLQGRTCHGTNFSGWYRTFERVKEKNAFPGPFSGVSIRISLGAQPRLRYHPGTI